MKAILFLGILSLQLFVGYLWIFEPKRMTQRTSLRGGSVVNL